MALALVPVWKPAMMKRATCCAVARSLAFPFHFCRSRQAAHSKRATSLRVSQRSRATPLDGNTTGVQAPAELLRRAPLPSRSHRKSAGSNSLASCRRNNRGHDQDAQRFPSAAHAFPQRPRHRLRPHWRSGRQWGHDRGCEGRLFR